MFNIKEVGIKLYADALLNADYGLSEKSVLSLYQEQNEKDIWIGTDGGGLNCLMPIPINFAIFHLHMEKKVCLHHGVDKTTFDITLWQGDIFL